MRCRISNALQHMPAAARFSVRGGGFLAGALSLLFQTPSSLRRRRKKTNKNTKKSTRHTNKQNGKRKKEKKGKNRVKCGMKAHEVRVTSTTAAAQHKTLPAYVCVYNQGADGSVCPPIRKTNEAASSAAEQQYIYVSNSFIFFSFLF